MKTLQEVKAAYLAEALASPVGGYVILDRNGEVMAHSASPFVHCYVDPLDLEWARANGYECKDEEIDGRVLTWVTAKERPGELFRSADGGYYAAASLPEQSDEYCTERYAAEIRSERDARLSDTDKYVQLSDVMVKGSAGKARTALTDDQKTAILKYREELRDMPATEGFPFVDYPVAPDCIKYEVEQAIERREAQRSFYA